MMFASFTGPFGAASAAVEKLQQALKAYSQISGNTLANPGTVDGIVGPRTRTAVQAVLPVLTSKISKTIASAITLAISAAALNPAAAAQIDGLITQYASELTTGLIALTTYKVATAPMPPSPEPTATAINTAVTTARRTGTLEALKNNLTSLAPHVQVPAMTSTPPMVLTPNQTWYKTWWGLSLLGVGAVSVLALLLSRRG